MVKQMFMYKIYGLIIRSDMEIEELISVNQFSNYDATISLAKVPRHIENIVYDGEKVKYSREKFYLHIQDVAHFYVAHGTLVIVELEGKGRLSEVKAFLLGSCLGILLSQRNTIAIHGGAVAINGAAIIITGETGAGKSSLISAFINSHYKFLADDVVALEKEKNGDVAAIPAFPQQKLCRDVMKIMGYQIEAGSLIDKQRDKFTISVRRSFLPKSVPLKAIYEINVIDKGNVRVEELIGTAKLILILKNIYRIEIISLENFEPEYFKKCIQIAKAVKAYKITRPKNKFSLDEQVMLIEKTLGIGRNVPATLDLKQYSQF